MAADRELPNIVLILADDLGYGDVRCLNARGKIPTPHLDRLAAEGMTFTDAHSGSAVCTPTRYGILTGRYAWRTRLGQSVLFGYDPPLIARARLTVGKLLQSRGYHTACIGKWHLGMGWPLKQGGFAVDERHAWDVDYAKPIEDGPITRGFDTFFGISASLDMPPFVFIEDDRAARVPTVEKEWIRKGPAAADFEAIDVLPRLVERAERYIEERAVDSQEDGLEREGRANPFFLYLPLSSPHTPIVPAAEFAGRSGMTAYADFVMQTDTAVGRVLAALDRTGAARDTLVVFTSDNGCSPQADFDRLAAFDHHPSGPFRGWKADIFEGGHRVPFFARWPGRISADSRSAQTIGLFDFLATCAELIGTPLPEHAGEDSVSFLPILLGRGERAAREAIVHHSINGSFAIRQDEWKLCFCPDSGGWSPPRPGTEAARDLPPIQLFNLASDLSETANRADRHADVVDRMTRVLERYVAEGRSTPGASQPNDRKVSIGKPLKPAGK
ncbi:MAG: arylsulfatase [Planctomycetes bacterium]|nr:arylsulfatase [Planctomycetota bacterium]